MTEDERKLMVRLCAQINVEQDHQRLMLLLEELNDLLDGKKRDASADLRSRVPRSSSAF